MTKIFFEVEVADDSYMGFEDIMKQIRYDEQLRKDLLVPKYQASVGMFGRLVIQFYDHTFVIKEEALVSVLFHVYINAAIGILKNEIYQQPLEETFPNLITFDFTDCKDVGVRIKHYTYKDYLDNQGRHVFTSFSSHVIQEIMVFKQEFIEQVIICSEQYFAYSDELNFPFPHPHYEYWRDTLKTLKEQFYSSQ